MTLTSVPGVVALVFDVFGTVVDWRSSIIRELEAFGRERNIVADWTALADAWRAGYQPSMERVRKGERSWTVIDDLHRETLESLLPKFGMTNLSGPRSFILSTPGTASTLGPTPSRVSRVSSAATSSARSRTATWRCCSTWRSTRDCRGT